jgi:predicted nuclease of restriction endonuclease-like RecB superfamily
MIPEFKTLSFVKGKLTQAKVQDAVYTPDFLIKTEFGNVYLEVKGFFRPADRIRFKLCQTLTKIINKGSSNMIAIVI